MSPGDETQTPRVVDLMVAGAGPAGLAAAAQAAELGVQVILVDEQPRPGGQIFRRPGGAPAPPLPRYARRVAGVYESPATRGIAYEPGRCIWGLSRDGTVYVADAYGTRIYAPYQLILATGAYEWVLPVTGWTLPGVTTAGGAQTLLKTAGVLTGRRIVLGGAGPLLLQAAVQITQAGAEVAAIFDAGLRGEHTRAACRVLGHPHTALQGVHMLATLARRGVPIYRGWSITEIRGAECVTGIAAASLGPAEPPKSLSLDVDAVCLSFGLVPAIELAALRGCALTFDRPLGTWAVARNDTMATSIPGVYAVGDGAAIRGARSAVLEGTIAGVSAAEALGRVSPENAQRMRRPLQRALRRLAPIRRYNEIACSNRPQLVDLIGDATVVCRCEEVRAASIRRAIDEGARSLHELRTRCRVGMGSCQGRMCVTTAARMLARKQGVDLELLGFPRQRPPLRPLNLEELSRPERGRAAKESA